MNKNLELSQLIQLMLKEQRRRDQYPVSLEDESAVLPSTEIKSIGSNRQFRRRVINGSEDEVVLVYYWSIGTVGYRNYERTLQRLARERIRIFTLNVNSDIQSVRNAYSEHARFVGSGNRQITSEFDPDYGKVPKLQFWAAGMPVGMIVADDITFTLARDMHVEAQELLPQVDPAPSTPSEPAPQPQATTRRQRRRQEKQRRLAAQAACEAEGMTLGPDGLSCVPVQPEQASTVQAAPASVTVDQSRTPLFSEGQFLCIVGGHPDDHGIEVEVLEVKEDAAAEGFEYLVTPISEQDDVSAESADESWYVLEDELAIDCVGDSEGDPLAQALAAAESDTVELQPCDTRGPDNYFSNATITVDDQALTGLVWKTTNETVGSVVMSNGDPEERTGCQDHRYAYIPGRGFYYQSDGTGAWQQQETRTSIENITKLTVPSGYPVPWPPDVAQSGTTSRPRTPPSPAPPQSTQSTHGWSNVIAALSGYEGEKISSPQRSGSGIDSDGNDYLNLSPTIQILGDQENWYAARADAEAMSELLRPVGVEDEVEYVADLSVFENGEYTQFVIGDSYPQSARIRIYALR